MGWIKDNERIVAMYMGERVTGIVESSRVKYGGNVQYTVNLDSPVHFPWRKELVTRVLVDSEEILGEK